MNGFRENNGLYCRGACCLCGKKDGKLTPGTVRSVGGFRDCPVEFCPDCVKGMALAESDERKKELGGTFVGRFIDVEEGSIVLKDLSGLREKMAQSLRRSIEEGLRFNPLAGAYSDLIKIDVESCHFEIEKGAYTANLQASSFARDVIAFSRGTTAGYYGAAKCPACGTSVRCLSWKNASFGDPEDKAPPRKFACAFGCIELNMDPVTARRMWDEEIERCRWSFSRPAGRGGIGEFSVPANGAAGNYEGMLFKLGRRVGRSVRIISEVSGLLGEKFLERGGKADSKKLVEISDGLVEKLKRMDGMELPDGRGKFKYSDFKYGFLARL